MKNTYKINNQEKELLDLLTKIVLSNVEKNGTDILLGKLNRSKTKDIIEEKNEFDKMCETNIDAEPELQVSLSKYKINNKEYYHIGICSSSILNSDSDDSEIEKDNSENKIDDNKLEYKGKNKITSRQMELLKVIKDNPYIKYDELKDVLGVSKGTISIDLKVLKKMKVLERVGTNDGRWLINKNLLGI